ncbi:hypothetical protein GCM10010505_54410 [Kitasatospora aburaviensis]
MTQAHRIGNVFDLSGSVEAGLVALGALHPDARLVLVIGEQDPFGQRAACDQSCESGLECGQVFLADKSGADVRPVPPTKDAGRPGPCRVGGKGRAVRCEAGL